MRIYAADFERGQWAASEVIRTNGQPAWDLIARLSVGYAAGFYYEWEAQN